ncbi:hypothetical protein [Aeromicrobium sp. 179-A 4D2 NHS]|uniref:hypothetical protein n=1 Tax=Aeromicrobium sp. 179-A 4D2 NHS TaxID=3142375 RepID=UPI0039A252F6
MIHAVLNIRDNAGVVVSQTAFHADEVSMPGYVDSVRRGYDGTEWTTELITVIGQES